MKRMNADGRAGGRLAGRLRPTLPQLKPGETYLVEVVVRTLNLGHPFTQGTVDSNEIWVDFTATAGGKVIGRSGALSGPDDTGEVDPWSHFINVSCSTATATASTAATRRTSSRRSTTSRFRPARGRSSTSGSTVPKDVTGPVELTVRLRYRKFDYKYMELVHKESGKPVPKLPIVDMCEDTVTLPVAGVAESVPAQESPIKPAWQRWNDYGIGCLLEGGAGSKKGNLQQAEAAFRKLLTLGVKDAVWHGHLNLARVYIDQGRLTEATRELNAAQTCDPPAPWWVLAWFKGLVTAQNATTRADLETAAALFEKIVDPANQPKHEDGKLKFDFTRDYVVLAELGRTLYKRSTLEPQNSEAERLFLLRAVSAYERALCGRSRRPRLALRVKPVLRPARARSQDRTRDHRPGDRGAAQGTRRRGGEERVSGRAAPDGGESTRRGCEGIRTTAAGSAEPEAAGDSRALRATATGLPRRERSVREDRARGGARRPAPRRRTRSTSRTNWPMRNRRPNTARRTPRRTPRPKPS